MKLSKNIPAFISAFAIICCTACSNKQNQDQSSSNGSSSFSSESSSGFLSDSDSSLNNSNTASASDGTSKKQAVKLVGLDGKEVEKGDVISIENADISMFDEMTYDELTNVTVKGAFVTMPTGVFRNSIDDAETFDHDSRTFSDVLENEESEFVKIYEGDEICGFKVSSAVSYYNKKLASNQEVIRLGGRCNEIYYGGSDIELEGTAEFTGYFGIADDKFYGVNNGDIEFCPTSCSTPFPLHSVSFSAREGFKPNGAFAVMIGDVTKLGEVILYSEYNYINLGNINDYDLDFSGMEVGEYTKAKITIDNIKMHSEPNQSFFSSRTSARLVSVEKID